VKSRKIKTPGRIQADHDRIAAETKARVDATRAYADYRRRLVDEGRVDSPKDYQVPLDFNARGPVVRAWVDNEIIVDSFAGGGGASTGIERALGRSPDIAINHDAAALAMHEANHPRTRHYREDVWDVDPVEATGGKPVDLAWFSPDCTFFSKARGAKPFRDRRKATRRRALAHVVVRWASAVRPRIICMENVEEFEDWGPLGADGLPDPAKIGLSFRRWRRQLENLGYQVEMKQLRACDYGAPTIRKRLFVVARCDGLRIVWPEPTHGPGRIPFRAAAECIDWTIPVPSIFGRRKPLAENTLRRIARGIQRFVVDAAEPFIVPQTHGDKGGKPDTRSHSIDEPLRTITSLGAQFHLVAPTLVPVTHAGYRSRVRTAASSRSSCRRWSRTTRRRRRMVIASPTSARRCRRRTRATASRSSLPRC
jgi:DNA (cytosine-5)-methyltransferase 1